MNEVHDTARVRIDPATHALAERIRGGLIDDGARYGARLPSERDLCAAYGTSRHRTRAALAHLEESGLIWRHVGRGTFVGARPVMNLKEVAYLGELITSEQIMTVRMSLEPEIASLAARRATQADRDRIELCHARCSESVDWSGYEAWDNHLHHAIARASQNRLFQHFFETVNVLRRSTKFGVPPRPAVPPPDYASFTQHAAIAAAITSGDAEGASAAMRTHLESVHARLNPADGQRHADASSDEWQ